MRVRQTILDSLKLACLAVMACTGTSAESANVYTLSPPILINSLIRIRNADSGLCIAVDSSSQHWASFVPCSDDPNTQFRILATSSNGDSTIKYQFQHGWTGLCLTADLSGFHRVYLAPCGAVPGKYSALQDWLPDTTKFLMASYVDGWKWCMWASPSGQAVQGGCTGMNRSMYLERVNTVRLRHEITAKCLYGSNVGGQPAHTWGCWQDPAMAISLESLGGSDVRIQIGKTMQCLYVATPNGGAVQSWGCGNDPNMVWVREDLGNNRARFRHKLTGTCMYGGATDGSEVKHWPCWSDPAMVWVVDPF
jgi:hypothetical protein